MGYILGGDTSQQKIPLFVGPKRAGKGTIARVLTGLLGAHNVAAPTLASLSTNFGLSPLIGKPLALISDARLSGRSDSSVVVERLLSISGEDSLTIDRKYLDQWTGRLPTRLALMTNELPQLDRRLRRARLPVHRLRPDTVVLWAGEPPADGRAAVRGPGDLQLGSGRARPAQQARPETRPGHSSHSTNATYGQQRGNAANRAGSEWRAHPLARRPLGQCVGACQRLLVHHGKASHRRRQVLTGCGMCLDKRWVRERREPASPAATWPLSWRVPGTAADAVRSRKHGPVAAERVNDPGGCVVYLGEGSP